MRKILILPIAAAALLAATSCDMAPRASPTVSPLANTPNHGTWYQIFVGTFFDSDGDGWGDLRGITMKLDHLACRPDCPHHRAAIDAGEDCLRSLHVNGIWLTPIHPSPSYHKYDVDCYVSIDPRLGTMDDFREFLREAHARGIKVILDLVLNHSSDRHRWFLNALEEIRAGRPGRYASFYHFYFGALPPQRESVEYTNWYWQWDARQDGGSWVPRRGISNRFFRHWGHVKPGVWWEGAFWTGMPDLNWDSQHLRDEVRRIAEFWLNMGVDGFRLDAVHYIYDWNDIGQMEHQFGFIGTASTHRVHDRNTEVLRWFTEVVRSISPNAFVIGECWRSIDIIENYFRSGMDFFNFDSSWRIRDVVQNRPGHSGASWAHFLSDWDMRIRARNPDAIISTFLSNHDMDRSFYIMGGERPDVWWRHPYRWEGGVRRWLTREEGWPEPNQGMMAGQGDLASARRRFAASLNILSPGAPFIYYGEEIGLVGNFIDFWSTDGTNDHHEFPWRPGWEFDFTQPHPRVTADSDWRGPMWWSNTNRAGIPFPPERRQWSLAAMQSRYGDGVEEQREDPYSLLRHYIRLGNLKYRHPQIAWGRMELVDLGSHHLGAWWIRDNTWPGNPAPRRKVLVVHNGNPHGNETFMLPDGITPHWIDGLSARNHNWIPSILPGDVIDMPPFSSAIVGTAEWAYRPGRPRR